MYVCAHGAGLKHEDECGVEHGGVKTWALESMGYGGPCHHTYWLYVALSPSLNFTNFQLFGIKYFT